MRGRPSQMYVCRIFRAPVRFRLSWFYFQRCHFLPAGEIYGLEDWDYSFKAITSFFAAPPADGSVPEDGTAKDGWNALSVRPRIRVKRRSNTGGRYDLASFTAVARFRNRRDPRASTQSTTTRLRTRANTVSAGFTERPQREA